MLQLMHELGRAPGLARVCTWPSAAGSAAGSQAVGQAPRQSGFQNLGLGFLYIVLEAAQFNRAGLKVVNHISGAGIAITRLPTLPTLTKYFFPFST